jgi:hypothetical protein
MKSRAQEVCVCPMCAGGGDATIGDERIHWRTKRTGDVRNRIGDISMRSAGTMLGTALAASLLFTAPAGAAAPNTWGAVGSLKSARALAASAVRATIADAFDLTLAHKTLGISAAKRTITLRPSRNLVGDPSRVKVQLVIVAYDAAGSRSTTTRTITVRR